MLTKHVDGRRVRQGQRLRYTLTVTNHGPDMARHVRLTDTPRLAVRIIAIHAGQGRCRPGPPLTCTLATLRSGAHTTITITATATTAGVQTNTAAVRSASTDPHPAINVAAAITRITPTRRAPRPKRPKPPPKRPKPPPPRFTG